MTAYFHRVAATEYQAARDWYAERSEQAAERFRQAVVAAVKRIEKATESHECIAGSYQHVRVVRFPYTLVFRQSSKRILIVAVAHTSRRPEYWRRR